MHRVNLAFLSAAAITALFLTVSSGKAEDRGRTERRGETLLSRHCGMCHAVGRSGSSPHRQAPPFRTLSQHYPIESLSEALGEGLFTGHPNMPEFVFPPRDVGAILRYLESIQQR
jgi:cytochrome c